jgi:hypothetical protein
MVAARLLRVDSLCLFINNNTLVNLSKKESALSENINNNCEKLNIISSAP